MASSTLIVFDEHSYRVANQNIIKQIKDTHDWKGEEGFISDGVICPTTFSKQSTRILCILAESYGYDRCEETSIELQPSQDVLGLTNGVVKAPRKWQR